MQMVFRALLGLQLSCLSILAQTWFAEITAVDEVAGEVVVRTVHALGDPPTRLRVNAQEQSALVVGSIVRLRAGQYEGAWWVDAWWPVQAKAAQRFIDERWWQPSDQAENAPQRLILGLDEKGAWVDLADQAFRFGYFIVPYGKSPAQPLPVALEQWKRLAERLATTPHRDLPVLFWSLEPESDALSEVLSWQEALGPAAAYARWVSGLSEEHQRWIQQLSLALFKVEGQPLLTNPTVLAFTGGGQEIARYEGHQWPVDTVVQKLDQALLSRANAGKD